MPSISLCNSGDSANPPNAVVVVTAYTCKPLLSLQHSFKGNFPRSLKRGSNLVPSAASCVSRLSILCSRPRARLPIIALGSRSSGRGSCAKPSIVHRQVEETAAAAAEARLLGVVVVDPRRGWPPSFRAMRSSP
ncbi:hypothetical protein CLOM_g16252 [Closterium sp. NIES-68]|nr:hypothetical protein CLOM_g16252 [Closterium sp. NIES-68]GJP67457.1 hypothetical protein CLOP_g24277 [Closterium sp. NIES-67]